MSKLYQQLYFHSKEAESLSKDGHLEEAILEYNTAIVLITDSQNEIIPQFEDKIEYMKVRFTESIKILKMKQKTIDYAKKFKIITTNVKQTEEREKEIIEEKENIQTDKKLIDDFHINSPNSVIKIKLEEEPSLQLSITNEIKEACNSLHIEFGTFIEDILNKLAGLLNIQKVIIRGMEELIDPNRNRIEREKLSIYMEAAVGEHPHNSTNPFLNEVFNNCIEVQQIKKKLLPLKKLHRDFAGFLKIIAGRGRGFGGELGELLNMVYKAEKDKHEMGIRRTRENIGEFLVEPNQSKGGEYPETEEIYKSEERSMTTPIILSDYECQTELTNHKISEMLNLLKKFELTVKNQDTKLQEAMSEISKQKIEINNQNKNITLNVKTEDRKEIFQTNEINHEKCKSEMEAISKAFQTKETFLKKKLKEMKIQIQNLEKDLKETFDKKELYKKKIVELMKEKKKNKAVEEEILKEEHHI